MGRIHSILMLLVVFSLGFPLPAAAEGNWVDAYGVGARAVALGGAFAAVADDHTTLNYNMAGLGQMKKNIFALEYMFVRPHIKIENQDTGSDIVVRWKDGTVRADPAAASEGHGLDFHTFMVGVVLNINKLTDRYIKLPNMCLGVNVALPENFQTALCTPFQPPDEPHLISYGDQTKTTLTRAGLGVELMPGLFYAGAGISMSTQGEGSIYHPNVEVGGSEGALTSGGYLHTQPYNSIEAGILLTPLNRRLRLAYAFQGHSQTEFDRLNVTAEVNTFIMYPLDVTILGQIYTCYLPERHRFGLAYDFSRLLVACDVVVKKWSKFDYNETERLLYSEANREGEVYSMQGIIPDGPEFKDTLDIHVGAELRVGDQIKIMGGFMSRPSPVPDQSGKVTNYIDMDQKMYSLGGSYKLKKIDAELSAALRYVSMRDVSVDKTLPDGTQVRGLTWGNGTANNVDQQSYAVSGKSFAVFTGAKFSF